MPMAMSANSRARSVLAALIPMLATGAAPPPPATFDAEGIEATIGVNPGTTRGEARLRIVLRDSATGAPVRGAHPLGWLASADAAEGGTQEGCDRLVRSLIQGGLQSRARADFNAMRILSLTDRDDLIALNPTVSLGGTQIEQAIHLRAPATVAAMSPDRTTLALAMRGIDALSLVDPATFDQARDVPLGAPPVAMRWVGDRLIVATATELVTIAGGRIVERGPHRLGAPPEQLAASDRVVLVAAGRNAILIDRASGRTIGISALPAPIVAARYAALADTFLLLAGDGSLRSLSANLAARAVAPGIALRAIEPVGEGRHWLALSIDGRTVLLIDAATGGIPARAELSGAMDAIVVGDHYAYIHSRGGDTVDLADLSRIAGGAIDLVTVPVGEREAAGEPGPGPRVALLSGSAVIASPSGQRLAYYVEGMMAPMGSIPHYGLGTRGLFAIDDSLREQSPGTYVATARYRQGGTMLLPVLLDRPKMARCIPVHLPLYGTPRPAVAPPLQFAIAPARPLASISARLEVRPSARSPAPTVRLLVRGDGNWQRHLIATRDPSGRYLATVRFPLPGVYHVTAQSVALGHRFGDQSFDVDVRAKP